MTSVRSNHQNNLQRIDRNNDGIVQKNEAKLVGYQAKSGAISKKDALNALEAGKKANTESKTSTKDKASVEFLNAVIKDIDANVMSFPKPGPKQPPSHQASSIPKVNRMQQPSPQPGPMPPSPGSKEYKQLVANGKAVTIEDVKRYLLQGAETAGKAIDAVEVPVLSQKADMLKEASLDLGARYGMAGIVVGATTATAIEFFVPTNLVDFIPGGKVVRKGKHISTIRMSLQEFKDIPKIVKGGNYEQTIKDRLQAATTDVKGKVPSIDSPPSSSLLYCQSEINVWRYKISSKTYWYKCLDKHRWENNPIPIQ